MQDVLYFHRDEADGSSPSWSSSTRPTWPMPGYPDDRLIAVDLEHGVTRVFNSDYFGESKKGGLRMWNKLVYERGGLALHAGCKVIPTPSGDRGRPDRRPVGHRQDHDDVHAPERLAAGAGRLRRLVAGRHGLRRPRPAASPRPSRSTRGRADDLRRRHAPRAPTSRTSAWTTHGEVDFFDTELHARTAAPCSRSPTSRRPTRATSSAAHFLLILNRNENMIPAVAQPRGAAGRGVLHARRDDRARPPAARTRRASSCACPGTNPFFPMQPRPAGQPLPRAAGRRTRSRST